MEWIELDARLEEKKRALVRRQQREAARRRREEAARLQEQEKVAARCREMALEDALSTRMAAWSAAAEECKRTEEKREADVRLFQQIAEVCRRAKELGASLSTPEASPEERLRVLKARIDAKEAARTRALTAKQRLDEQPKKRAKVKVMMRRFFASSVRKKMERAVYDRACARFLPLLEPTNDLADNAAAAMLNHESENGLTPVMDAIFTGELTVLRRLLQLGSSANYETAAGMTPLIAAVMMDDVVAVSILVEFKADLSHETAGGVTPLLIAADKGRSRVIKALLECGAEVDAVNKYGRSALIQAVKAGHYDIVRVLLAHNSNTSIRDSSDRTALDWAERLKLTATQALLSSSVPSTTLKAQLEAEATAAEEGMHAAALSHAGVQQKRSVMLENFMRERNLANMFELLSTESDFLSPNYEASDGTTPLLLSCLFGTVADVLRCLERKCIPTHQNREGVSALMIACKRGDTAMIGLLMKAGCSLLTRDYHGRDSLAYLNVNDHPALAEQLTSAHRSAKTQAPLVYLGTPIESVEPLRSSQSSDRHNEDPSQDEPCGDSERALFTDRTSAVGPQNDSSSDEPTRDPDIRRWGTRQRVLKKNRQRREHYDAERQRILTAATCGRRNGLIAPLPADPNGRWKFPVCNNCKQSKARKRCFNCEQMLCDKCHARLHELAHRRHHKYEEVAPELYVGDKRLLEVQERRDISFNALVTRSRDCISSIRAVLLEESPQTFPAPKLPDTEVDKYELKKRAEKEKEVMLRQINVPVAAAKQAAVSGEAAIFAEPAELELARLYMTQKKYEKARTVFLQAKVIVETAVGILHPTMLQIATGIARIDQEIGQSAKCAHEIEQAITVFESVLPPDDQGIVEATGLLLTSLDTQGRYDDAVRVCRRVRDRNRLADSPINRLNDRLDEFTSKQENAQMGKHDELVRSKNEKAMEAAEVIARANETRIGSFHRLLLDSSKETKSFLEFARSEFAVDLVHFWIAVEEWKKDTSDSKAFRARAVQIYLTFIKSRRIKVITAVQKKRIKKVLTTPGKKMPATVFDDIQEVVFGVVFNGVYARFLEATAQSHAKEQSASRGAGVTLGSSTVEEASVVG